MGSFVSNRTLLDALTLGFRAHKLQCGVGWRVADDFDINQSCLASCGEDLQLSNFLSPLGIDDPQRAVAGERRDYLLYAW
jgi:hypothetical protein